MRDGIWDDPEAQAWRERHNRELLPMIEQSAIVLSLWNSKPDAKMAVELGFAILLNKPLLIVAREGEEIPPALERLAEVVFRYSGDLDSEENRRRMVEAIKAMPIPPEVHPDDAAYAREVEERQARAEAEAEEDDDAEL